MFLPSPEELPTCGDSTCPGPWLLLPGNRFFYEFRPSVLSFHSPWSCSSLLCPLIFFHSERACWLYSDYLLVKKTEHFFLFLPLNVSVSFPLPVLRKKMCLCVPECYVTTALCLCHSVWPAGQNWSPHYSCSMITTETASRALEIFVGIWWGNFNFIFISSNNKCGTCILHVLLFPFSKNPCLLHFT